MISAFQSWEIRVVISIFFIKYKDRILGKGEIISHPESPYTQQAILELDHEASVGVS